MRKILHCESIVQLLPFTTVVAAEMGHVSMMDSDRLSSLLKDALAWSDHVSSLLISATNGSILAYAYRDENPKIRDVRTRSTTMTAAYTMASEDVLVFEAQNMGGISVITLVADRVLLAVTGPELTKPTPIPNGHAHDDENEDPTVNGISESEEHEEDTTVEQDTDTQQIRDDLELVSQELADALREELATIKVPDDI